MASLTTQHASAMLRADELDIRLAQFEKEVCQVFVQLYVCLCECMCVYKHLC